MDKVVMGGVARGVVRSTSAHFDLHRFTRVSQRAKAPTSVEAMAKAAVASESDDIVWFMVHNN